MEARKVCLYSLILAFLLMLCAPAHAIIYVSKSGNNANNGLSWATSKLTIQAGVTLAATQVDKTVWVAVGTLPPPALPAQPTPIPYVENITIPANVAVYGGFRGDEAASSPPPVRTLKTIVHSAVAGTPIFTAGTCDIIDGFTIENNTADRGAGVFLTGTSATLSNDLFQNNHARQGAAVYAGIASLSVSNSQFVGDVVTDTTPTLAGGASIFSIGGSLIVFHSSFTNERARVTTTSGDSSAGGAIYSTGATLVKLDRCIFESCIANGNAAVVLASGGAVFVGSAMTFVTNCLFHACAARGSGLPQPAFGGAIFFKNQGSIQIVNNTFVGNAVTPQAGLITDVDRPYGLGGAIYLTGATTAKVVNNIITQTLGTAVVNNGLIVTFNYNLLWHNAGGDIFGFNFPVQNPPSSTDNNIMKDPQFLKGDPLFHITFGSPAKDAGLNVGSPGFDIDGETRPFNVIVDIGADEFVDSDGDGGADTNPLETTPFAILPPETDLDGDGVYTPYDNCPTLANPHQVDSNGDGIGDVCEGIPEVFYVNAAAAPGGNGLSWATAFQTIQQGINAADLHNQTNVDGATPWTGVNPYVWVKKGVYNENPMIWHGVQVYGSFNGTELPPSLNPDWLAARLPLVNVTQINGNALGSTVVIAHLPQDRYLTGATKTAYDLLVPTIDGFLITFGAAEIGGGVSVYKEPANVSSDRINGNQAALGGGIYFYKSVGTVGDGIGPAPGNLLTGDTTIISNVATGQPSYAGFGGGVYAERGSPLVFANLIEGNTAFWGGGAAGRWSAPVFVEDLIGCSTSPNTATGTAANGKGGGVYLDNKSDAAFEEDTIVSNVAAGASGQGGGIWFDSSDFQMDLTIDAFNTAVAGALIWANAPNAQVVQHPLCYITNSDFFPITPTSFFGIPNPTDPTLATLQCPLTNFAVDPLFVNPATCNYRLQAGSPLRLDFANVGAFQDVDPPVSIAEAKKLANGITVEVSDAVVSAVFPDGFYIEDAKRTSGIKVIMQNPAVTEGQAVNVTGVVTTLNDEQQIINATVLAAADGAATPVGPLAMANTVMGSASALPGLAKGLGLGNVGLLVKTWGKVTASGTSPYPYFTIDDGSGVGVKVRALSASGLPDIGKSVVVIGISGVEKDAAGNRLRLLRIRKAADISIPQ